MKHRIVGLGLLLIASALEAGGGITVINVNDRNGAWVGYDDGTVRYCNGGGGTAIPYWTSCTTVMESTGAAVTAIDSLERRAWVGHADGVLRYCRESGSEQRPQAECIESKP